MALRKTPSKRTVVRFINKKGQWVEELCHDIKTCREHSSRLVETKKILKKNPDLKLLQFEELNTEENETEIINLQTYETYSGTPDMKLREITEMLKPNTGAENSINSQIKQWKNMMKLRPKGEYLENLLDNTFRANNVETNWEPGSHKISEDMKIMLNGEETTVSVKTGIWNEETKTLKISGSRTGKHKTIGEKIAHLKGTSAEIYLLIAGKEGAKIDDPYYMITFHHGMIDFGEPEDWTEDDKKWFLDTPDARLEIRKSMSDQLWVELKNTDMLTAEKLTL